MGQAVPRQAQGECVVAFAVRVVGGEVESAGVVVRRDPRLPELAVHEHAQGFLGSRGARLGRVREGNDRFAGGQPPQVAHGAAAEGAAPRGRNGNCVP